jgi:hypothetical protein
MSSSSTWASGRAFAAGIVAAGAFAIGCGSEGRGSSGFGYGGGGGYSSGAGSSGGSGWGAGATGKPTRPMLVVVDPDRTLNAAAGQGVGVFTEYQKGGHWRVWWTCDTGKTAQACHFDVTVTLASGALVNPSGISLAPPDSVTQPSTQEIDTTTTTTTSEDGVEFDTPAGSTITVDAQVDGVRDGAILFFVQDGKVNGGYGPVTDPLMLQPQSP